MGRLPHPAGEGEENGWKPKKKHPAKSALRRWVHLEFIHRYSKFNPVTYSHSGTQRYSVPGAKASHHRLRYPLASYAHSIAQKSTIRVWSFYKFY